MRDQSPDWTRLDNAAKIFPPTSNKQDTKVFRFACQLNEWVEQDILQQATEKTLETFPIFRSVLKHGLFWYYLEKTELVPVVEPEYRPPCGQIYDPSSRNLLFEVTCWRNRINLEVYHSLTDGTGALQFLKTLLPDPATLGPRTKGKTNIGCIFIGKKDGQEKKLYIYNTCDHQECYKEVGSQAISYTTGVPAMVGAMMLLTGKWNKPGVYTVEEFDPDPYMDALNQWGLPWQIDENPALVD